jgi:hypothetical protein
MHAQKLAGLAGRLSDTQSQGLGSHPVLDGQYTSLELLALIAGWLNAPIAEVRGV